MKLSDLKSLIKEYGGPPISRKAYLKQKPMDPKLDEGRMKELHGYIERGMTAQQIAKKMKLDVKTIKALMPEAVTEAKGKYASDAQMDDFLKGMEKNPDVKKMSKHYNRPVGDIVKALRARVSVSRLRGGNVYTLNFTDKDSKLKVKAKKQYAPIKEAVNEVASDKWRDDIAMDVAKKNPKTHGHALELIRKHPTMKKLFKRGVNPMRGADFNDELLGTVDKILKSKGKKYMRPGGPKESVSEAKVESRAYRDAMKGLRSRSATRGMATTKKDKDTDASDDDRKAASKNIIMQLRKAADLSTGADVEFEKGKGKVDRRSAQDVLAKFNRLRKPMDKEKFQQSIKSLADIKKILGR